MIYRLVTTSLFLPVSINSFSLTPHLCCHGVTKTVTTPTISTTPLQSSSSSQEKTDFIPERSVKTPELTPEDESLAASILTTASSPDALTTTLLQTLPSMSPSLILSIRTATADVNPQLLPLQKPLVTLLDDFLAGAKDTLQELLRCGEIRKLDGSIGRAAKEGKLDMAFFTVLNMNIADAAREEKPKEEKEDGNDDDSAADRSAILRHISTRCQEEMEKLVDPGVALLNKLLRTDVLSIRQNQLQHYLSPQTNDITTPDGKTVSLAPRPALVPPSSLLSALSNAVERIRAVEGVGGTDRVTAAGLVEDCRQVAIEARGVIYEVYGGESGEVRDFERGLQPVFRPGQEMAE